MIKLLLTVGLGGAIGSLMRYGAGALITRSAAYTFPVSTFVVNVIGCFLIGLFYALSERHTWFTAEWRFFFVTGFCGGLTTFSAFAYENIKLLQSGNTMYFLLYSIASFVLSLLAVLAGMYIVKLI